MKRKTDIYIIIFLFLFIYSPWILPINVCHILFIISIISISMNINGSLDTLKRTNLLRLVKIFFCVFGYILFNILIYGTNIINSYEYFVIFFEVPIVVLYLYNYFQKKNYLFDDIIDLIFTIAMIQAFLGILAFISTDVKKILVELLLKNISDINKEKILGFSWYRFNGFSGSLNYTTPITQVVIATISMYKAIYLKKSKYILITPFLVFSAIINARISLIIILFSFMLLVFYSRRFIDFAKFIFIILFLPVLIYPFSLLVGKQDNYVGIWISRGFKEVLGLFVGGNENTVTADALLQSHFNLPDAIGFLFGKGHDIYGSFSRYGFSSDIGYINNIWIMGVFLTTILILGVIRFYLRLNKKGDVRFNKFLSILFIGTFLISNIKGNIISYNDFMALSLVLSTSSYLSKEKAKE